MTFKSITKINTRRCGKSDSYNFCSTNYVVFKYSKISERDIVDQKKTAFQKCMRRYGTGLT